VNHLGDVAKLSGGAFPPWSDSYPCWQELFGDAIAPLRRRDVMYGRSCLGRTGPDVWDGMARHGMADGRGERRGKLMVCSLPCVFGLAVYPCRPECMRRTARFMFLFWEMGRFI
jgi:hypothetical protein